MYEIITIYQILQSIRINLIIYSNKNKDDIAKLYMSEIEWLQSNTILHIRRISIDYTVVMRASGFRVA